MTKNRTYAKHINNAFRFIEENLSDELSLESIARAAFYSPYHFHRVFSAITGETVNEYVSRKRLEKAALLLQTDRDLSVSDIAFRCGYNSHAGFTRAFKKQFGMSPKALGDLTTGTYSKISKVKSKNDQTAVAFESYLSRMENLMEWITNEADISIIQTNDQSAASVTHLGEQGVGNSFTRLIRWCERNNLLEGPDFKMGVLYHDSYKVTAPEKVRMNVFLLTNKELPADEEVHSISLSGGKYIKASLAISPQVISKAWTALFIWMNENHYRKAEMPPYEIYHNDFNTHPEKKCIMDLYIPIE